MGLDHSGSVARYVWSDSFLVVFGDTENSGYDIGGGEGVLIEDDDEEVGE